MIKPLIVAWLVGAMLSITPVAQAQFSTHPPTWVKPAAGTLLPELIKELWLTEAEVIDVKDEKNGFRSTLKVTHVYCGPNQLLGKTFSAYTPKSGIPDWHGAGMEIIPVMHHGEKGIFAVRWSSPTRLHPDGGLQYIRHDAYGYDFPAREKGNPNFDEAQAYAETIEQICKATPDDEIRMLKDYAVGQKSPIGAWAIHSLAAIQPGKMVAFIENLSTKKLPNKSLLAVDDALLLLQEKTWPKSKARFKLLGRVIDRKLDDAEGREISIKLAAMVQSGEYEETQLLHLLKAIINNPNAPLKTRRSTVILMGNAATQGRINMHDAAASLLKWIKGPMDEDIRIAAASMIGNRVTLSNEQIASVRALKDQVTNDKLVAYYLQQAIDRAEGETGSPRLFD